MSVKQTEFTNTIIFAKFTIKIKV